MSPDRTTDAGPTWRILIVDDHEVVREGLRSGLAAYPNYEVVGAASDGREAKALLRRFLPDVVLLDLRLGDTSGLDLCRELLKLSPSLKVVFLTTYLSEETVRQAIAVGAAAYVTKAAGLGALRDTLEELAEDGTRGDEPPKIVQQLRELMSSRQDHALLTPQQATVLELATQGLTYQQIGAKLFISESTVRFHIQRLKAKLGTRTKTELIAKAIRTGAIAPAAEPQDRHRL